MVEKHEVSVGHVSVQPHTYIHHPAWAPVLGYRAHASSYRKEIDKAG